MPRPDPAQRPRLTEIRENLVARTAETEREGWLGEIEGLRVSLAGAEAKIGQIDSAAPAGAGPPGAADAPVHPARVNGTGRGQGERHLGSRQ
ncbi:hypothetical protein EDD90_10734 [Streptomyces sp. Ag109_O5-1]|uniref:hypothetical protein n=1 Tax=Streptomyces sp. Ag109_O5-1 TaxID=1938851 RepID=UPI000FB74062|nr:hypothetical protein [Streptomyces sp. Ag109_O5-1]RPE27062.1 hypothetical protein EDD90_10734 [Streptomyces sp. Ag109_O5-1]